jgi:hypothetical protein
MKLSANDLMTRPSVAASRTLLIVSAGTIFIILYELTPESMTFFGLRVSPEAFRDGSLFTIALLVLGLLVNWWGDFQAYRKWFKSNEVNKGALYSDYTKELGTPLMESLRAKLQDLKGYYSELDEKINSVDSNREKPQELHKLQAKIQDLDGTVGEIHGLISGLDETLSELDVHFSKVHWIAKVQLFGWYLGLPLLLSGWAIWLLLCSSPN